MNKNNFMEIAESAAKNSKDPSTKVGACIVDKNGLIVSAGYNHFPLNTSEQQYTWDKEGDFLNIKYTYVVHAELDAILKSGKDLSGATLYVTLFPCNECAKAIIQSGIKHIYYKDDKYADKPSTIASKRMLEAAKVTFEQL